MFDGDAATERNDYLREKAKAVLSAGDADCCRKLEIAAGL
jgi:hypothetical protein